jgi:hypothetical protein
MQHDQKQLHQIAQDYPWYMFTVEEIALLCNVSRDVVGKVRAAADSPFCLNKCRPEWFAEWMRAHPEFQLTKGTAPEQKAQYVEENEFECSSPRILKMVEGAKKKKPSPRQPGLPKSWA